jgi:transposase-like protein
VAGKYRKFTPEFREEAARMVVETSRPIADVARELGINETSLGNWVRASDLRKRVSLMWPDLVFSLP